MIPAILARLGAGAARGGAARVAAAEGASLGARGRILGFVSNGMTGAAMPGSPPPISRRAPSAPAQTPIPASSMPPKRNFLSSGAFNSPPPNPPSQNSSSPRSSSGSIGFTVLLVAYLLFHYFVDFLVLTFQYSPFRTILHVFVALCFSFVLLDGDSRKGRTNWAIVLVTVFTWLATAIITGSFPFTFGTVNPEFFIAIILIIFLFARGQSMGIASDVVACFLISAFILPFLSTLLGLVGLASIAKLGVFQYLVNYISPLFLPVWLFYLILFQHHKRVPNFWMWIMVIYLVWMLWPFFGEVIAQGSLNTATGGVSDSQAQVFLNRVRNAFSIDHVRDFVATTFNTTVKQINRQIDTAKGVDFEGEVERGSVRDAGLVLDEIKSGQQKLYPDQEAVFFTTLRARTFDSVVFVNTSCKAQSLKNPNFTVVGLLPFNTLEVTDFTNVNIDCTFPKNKLPTGTYEAKMAAEFNYVTSAYIQRYFAKPGLRQQLGNPSRTFEDSFYQFYKISERNPLSKYSAGPVELVMDIANPVIELPDYSKTATFSLRVGVKNNAASRWTGGSITRIHQVLISIPIGFSVADATGSERTLACSSGMNGKFTYVSGCSQDEFSTDYFNDVDCENYYNIIFTPDNLSAAQSIQVTPERARTQEVLFSCQIRASNPASILNNNAFATKSFRSRVAYEYRVEQRYPFTVEKPLSGTVRIDESTISQRQFCGQPNRYMIEPNYDLVFSYVPSKKEEFYKIYEQLSRDLPEPDKQLISSGSSCEVRNLILGQIMADWGQVQFNRDLGTYKFGYMQTTKDMVSYLAQKNKIDGVTPDSFSNMTDEQVVSLIKLNRFKYGADYLKLMLEECNNDIVCATGKYSCGRSFKYGDMNSCSSYDLCEYCQNRLVPDIVTLATQIDALDRSR